MLSSKGKAPNPKIPIFPKGLFCRPRCYLHPLSLRSHFLSFLFEENRRRKKIQIQPITHFSHLIILFLSTLFFFSSHAGTTFSSFIFIAITMSLLIHCSEPFFVPKIVHNLNPRPGKLYNFKPLSKSKTTGLKVSCKIKDYGVLGLDQNFSSYGPFSAPVKRGSKEEEEKQEYYVNLGYALRSLREDFPALFHRELSLDIYRDDIVFKDPLNTFVGIESYKSIFWALRFHGRMFFKALWIDLGSVTQPAENVIMVRWTVHGIARGPWESRGRFDGTSEYKLDKNGKIFQHRVDNVAHNTHSKFKVLRVEELLQSICCPSTPRPTYFEISSSTKRT